MLVVLGPEDTPSFKRRSKRETIEETIQEVHAGVRTAGADGGDKVIRVHARGDPLFDAVDQEEPPASRPSRLTTGSIGIGYHIKPYQCFCLTKGEGTLDCSYQRASQ